MNGQLISTTISDTPVTLHITGQEDENTHVFKTAGHTWLRSCEISSTGLIWQVLRVSSFKINYDKSAVGLHERA